MIRRPNVRAKCFQHNYRVCTPLNRYYSPRKYKIYTRYRCRWCQRPHQTWNFYWYPGFCYGCFSYMINFEPGLITRDVQQPSEERPS